MSNLETLTVDKSQMDDLLKSVSLYNDSQIYLTYKTRKNIEEAVNISIEKDLANKLLNFTPDPYSFLMKFLSLNSNLTWYVVKWDNGEFEVCQHNELEAIDNLKD